jgi:hypothetical protein
MNKYSCFLLICFVLLSVCSCKKKQDTTTVHPIDSVITVYDDYTALKPGNYWIYEDYMLDSVNGAAHAQGTYDSAYVGTDTTVNGNIYHRYYDEAFLASPSNPSYTITMLRDSLSYTINSAGNIVFSSQDFTSIFRTVTLGPDNASSYTRVVTEQMGFKDSVINVTAGTFTTSAFRQIFQFPSTYPFNPQREYDYWHAKNIGIIRSTTAFYSASPAIYERRLVRYYVQ